MHQPVFGGLSFPSLLLLWNKLPLAMRLTNDFVWLKWLALNDCACRRMLAYLTYLLYSYSFCNTLFHQSPLLIVFTTFAIHHSLTFSLFYTVKTRQFRRFTKLPQTNKPTTDCFTDSSTCFGFLCSLFWLFFVTSCSDSWRVGPLRLLGRWGPIDLGAHHVLTSNCFEWTRDPTIISTGPRICKSDTARGSDQVMTICVYIMHFASHCLSYSTGDFKSQ